MLTLLTITATSVTAIRYAHPDVSHTTILIAGVATASEIVRTLVTTREKLQRSREMLLLQDRFLADAGIELIGCEDDIAVFAATETFFTRLALEAIVIINQATPDQQTLVTRTIVGLSTAQLDRAQDITGFRVIGKQSAIADQYRERFHQDRL